MTCQKPESLTAEDLKAVLSYDAQTGLFHWLRTRRVAGCGRPDGYVIVGLYGRLYLAHRLAWLWMTGKWPEMHVDHINRSKGDNRFANLRQASVPQNLANSGPRTSSKTGIKGVSWCASTQKWRATITVNGRQKSLGRHRELEAAMAAYQAEATRLYGQYAATELGVTFYDLEGR